MLLRSPFLARSDVVKVRMMRDAISGSGRTMMFFIGESYGLHVDLISNPSFGSRNPHFLNASSPAMSDF